jgi:hypothetical protein
VLFLPAVVVLCLGQDATSTPAPPPAPTPPRVVVSAAIERRDEHVRDHFANDSTFDTATPVPHFFEQRYDASNTWIVVAADYPLARMAARTTFGFAPRRDTAGSDLDTFFDPSGDVIVTGTDGQVSLGSWSVSERLGLAHWRGVTFGVTVGYRRSAAVFPPDVVVTTHTQPSSTAQVFTTDRESTVSQIFESGFVVDARLPVGPRWLVRVNADALPTSRSVLSTSLPDTFATDVTAQALGFGAGAHVTIERAIGPIAVGGGLTLDGVWSYGQSAAYRARSAGVMAFVVFGATKR